MKGRPETAIENPNYIADMVECLAHLTDDELAALTEPRTGLHTVCRYLPTPADVHGFLRDRSARLEAVRPAPTTWRKIEDNPDAPWNQETDAERKRRVVQEALGYDPDTKGYVRPTRNAELVPPTKDDLEALKLAVKTPPAPASPRLRRFLMEQDYPLPRPDDGEGP